MVAEQVTKTIIWISNLVRQLVTSKATITSSSGGEEEKKERFKWNHHLKKGTEINMFSHDHRLNLRIPHPTSFDGVKPSFMGWSEEVIALLALTDNQELIPLIAAATSSKDVIQKNVMFKGMLSNLTQEIKRKTDDQVKKGAEKEMLRLKETSRIATGKFSHRPNFVTKNN